jgi:tetratricopeptide (TPR) repeat protein
MAWTKAKALQEAEKSVAQGKIPQAIRQYLEILENDPSDLTLLNTVGDLYVRERNITEGLKQFQRLAEAYVREGFNVKAIAIYRKISKIDPNSVEVLLKLAELYQLQGLSREAREQYLQAADFFKKRNQADRVLDVLHKLVQLDPENSTFRNRLATEYEQSGKEEEAAQVYFEFAEVVLRRKDLPAAETALKKAAELDPKNSKVTLLRARVAISRQQPEEAEKILTSSPDLAADPVSKEILLECYFASGKHSQAEALVLEAYRANPSDFAPVSNFVVLCLEKGDVESAFQSLSQLSEGLIEDENTGPLMEALRRVWNKAPQHLPTLELIYLICERTADEFSLPEILEALGHAYVQAGEWEKAEAPYTKLTQREPENHHYQSLLRQVHHKLGKEVLPVQAEDVADEDIALAPEGETVPQPEPVDAKQAAMVNEAIENSDLFARYNLVDKAVGELEKVLQVYPDQIEVNQRILEISRKRYPARASVAAAELVRVFTARGDLATANKYQAIASAKVTSPEVPAVSPPPPSPLEKVEEPVAAPPAPPEMSEQDSTLESAISAVAPETIAAPAPPPPAELVFDLAPAAPPSERGPAPDLELDFSGDLEAMTTHALEPATPPLKMAAAPVEIPAAEPPEQAAAPEEAPVEPAAKPVLGSTEPPPVAAPAPAVAPEETPATQAPAPAMAPEEAPVMQTPEPAVATEETPVTQAPAPAVVPEETPATRAPAPRMAPEEAPVIFVEVPPAPSEGGAPFDFEESKLEIDFYLEHGFEDEARQAVAALEKKCPGDKLVADLRRHLEESGALAPAEQPEAEVTEAAPAGQPARAPAAIPAEPEHEEWELPTTYAATRPLPPLAEPMNPPPEAEIVLEESAAQGSTSADFLRDLAGELPSSLDDLLAPREPRTTAPAPPAPGAAQLSGLLEEMEEPGFGAAAAPDDPETHYNLGVAFREMGLLEEAIGEFQKVVRGAGKEPYPPNFLQACSLLALCFMEKRMPAVAIRWYRRALEAPGLDEEAILALQYDLGLAYEQAGDARNALERFTEVYSQNIDFRDVAEKIRVLQQHV